MNRNTTLLATFLTITVALAGCTGGGGSKGTDEDKRVCEGQIGADCGGYDLGTSEGAISGLIIDDRYRPLAEARVLLLPIGLDAITNDNGEFGFVGLQPGSYTVKVSKEKHEAAPRRVDVVAGEFSEAVIEARRTVSDNSLIITQEFAIFIPCSFAVPVDTGVYGTAGYCAGLNGDTYRPGISGIDFSEYADVTYMVSELVANRDGKHLFTVRHDDGSAFGGETYGQANTDSGAYARIQLQFEQALEGRATWNNDKPMAILMFPAGTVGPLDTPDATGVEMGTRGQVVVSLFIGEPEVDIGTYAVLA